MTLSWDKAGVEIVQASEPGVSGAAPKRLTHAEAAALTNYEAMALGLPQLMEAVLVLEIEGRIDMPDFRIEHRVEPFNHMHPWVAYRRHGALLSAGERMMRVNLQQLRVFEALDLLAAARSDIAARLRAWPRLVEALHMPGRHQVLVVNDLPHLKVTAVEALSPHLLTRVGKDLTRVSHAAKAEWAMEAGRRYYIKQAA